MVSRIELTLQEIVFRLDLKYIKPSFLAYILVVFMNWCSSFGLYKKG